MFNFSLSEIIVVIVIALLVLTPDQIKTILKSILYIKKELQKVFVKLTDTIQ